MFDTLCGHSQVEVAQTFPNPFEASDTEAKVEMVGGIKAKCRLRRLEALERKQPCGPLQGHFLSRASSLFQRAAKVAETAFVEDTVHSRRSDSQMNTTSGTLRIFAVELDQSIELKRGDQAARGMGDISGAGAATRGQGLLEALHDL